MANSGPAAVDHDALFSNARTVVGGVSTPVHLRRLLDGCRLGRDVPTVSRDAGPVMAAGRTLLRYAAQLEDAGDGVSRTGKRKLPRAIVGATGLAAEVCVHALGVGLARAGTALGKASKALDDLATAQDRVARRDHDGVEALAWLVDQVAVAVAAYESVPDADWLPGRVQQFRTAAINAIDQRRTAHADLRTAADATARTLFHLANQARLARRSPTRLHAVDGRLGRARVARRGPVTINAWEWRSQTMSNAPKGREAWNGKYGIYSRPDVTIDTAASTMRVSVGIYTYAADYEKAEWERAIESKWSNKYDLVVRSFDQATVLHRFPITVDVEWAGNPITADEWVTPHAPTVDVNRGVIATGTTSELNWGTNDTVGVTHEFGHMLGNPDEYYTVDGIDHGDSHRLGGGVMNNPNEGPFARHYDLIRRAAATALGVREDQVQVE
jgi:hypothetical protein